MHPVHGAKKDAPTTKNRVKKRGCGEREREKESVRREEGSRGRKGGKEEDVKRYTPFLLRARMTSTGMRSSGELGVNRY